MPTSYSTLSSSSIRDPDEYNRWVRTIRNSAIEVINNPISTSRNRSYKPRAGDTVQGTSRGTCYSITNIRMELARINSVTTNTKDIELLILHHLDSSRIGTIERAESRYFDFVSRMDFRVGDSVRLKPNASLVSGENLNYLPGRIGFSTGIVREIDYGESGRSVYVEWTSDESVRAYSKESLMPEEVYKDSLLVEEVTISQLTEGQLIFISKDNFRRHSPSSSSINLPVHNFVAGRVVLVQDSLKRIGINFGKGFLGHTLNGSIKSTTGLYINLSDIILEESISVENRSGIPMPIISNIKKKEISKNIVKGSYSKCINTKGHINLTKGKIYEILDVIINEHSSTRDIVLIKDDINKVTEVLKSRFIRVEISIESAKELLDE